MSREFREPVVGDWEASWEAGGESLEDPVYLAACGVFGPALADSLEPLRGGTALEIGCYPGGFSAWLAREHGFTVSGFDFLAGTSAIGPQLTRQGLRVGRFWQADLRTEPVSEQFDAVASFGFVEHFVDLPAVIASQAAWVAPGGLLIVTVPRFRNFQWLAHRLVDRKSLKLHNTSTMSKRVLASAMESAGMEVVKVKDFGTCEFWVEPDINRGRMSTLLSVQLTRIGGGASRRVRDHGRPAGLANPVTSPFVVAIARRPQDLS